MPGTKREFDIVFNNKASERRYLLAKDYWSFKDQKISDRWRIDVGLVDHQREIYKVELDDDMILKFVTDNYRRGETMVMT